MMSIHRLKLPSIRIHDHPGSFDPGFDEASPARTMRSQPRDIPFKHSSPIAIAGSFHPNDVPPPLLPIHPIHHSEWGNPSEHGRERHGTPKSPLGAWGSGSMGLDCLGSCESSRGSWDSRRQDEHLREARSEFEKMQIRERYCYKYIYFTRPDNYAFLLCEPTLFSLMRSEQTSDFAV